MPAGSTHSATRTTREPAREALAGTQRVSLRWEMRYLPGASSPYRALTGHLPGASKGTRRVVRSLGRRLGLIPPSDVSNFGKGQFSYRTKDYNIIQAPGQDTSRCVTLGGLHTAAERGYNPQNRNRAQGPGEGGGVRCGVLARGERAGQVCYLRRGATGPAGVRTSRLWQAQCLARCGSVRTGRPHLPGKGEVLGGQGLSLLIDLRVRACRASLVTISPREATHHSREHSAHSK